MKIVENMCRNQQAPLRIADFDALQFISGNLTGQTFDYKGDKHLFIPLLGAHQLCNAAVVLDTIDVMRNRGWTIPREAIREGLLRAVWPCRLEIINHHPTVILDVVTNSLGADKFKQAVEQYFPEKRVVLVLGSLDYKQYLNMYDILLDTADDIVVVTASGGSGYNAFSLAQKLEGNGKRIYACDSIEGGAWLAERLCGDKGVIAGVGTFHIMAELRQYFTDRNTRAS